MLTITDLHWFPPFAEDIVDQFRHGLGAARASSSLLGFSGRDGFAHHLGEYVRHLLVVLSNWQLKEKAVEFSGQVLALFMLNLPHVAQVLFVAHQKHERVHVPADGKTDLVLFYGPSLWKTVTIQMIAY